MQSSWLENYTLLTFDKIDSTNDEAIRLIKKGIQGNILIVADKQTNGKGSKEKSWKSIAGNLHMSILLQPIVDINRITELPFLVAVILNETIKEFTSTLNAPKSDIKLKWPNDILVAGKKLAGILIESINLKGENYVIIGIGINTHFMPDIPNTEVTSLFSEGVILKNSTFFLNNFMQKFQPNYIKWMTNNNFNDTREKWLKSAYKLNNVVTIDNGIIKVSGIFKNIDLNGAICIELDNGNVQKFSSGQISFSK